MVAPIEGFTPVSHLLILPGIFYRLGTVIVAVVQVWFFLLPSIEAVPTTAAQIPWRVMSALHTGVFIPVCFVLKSTKHFIFHLHVFL